MLVKPTLSFSKPKKTVSYSICWPGNRQVGAKVNDGRRGAMRRLEDLLRCASVHVCISTRMRDTELGRTHRPNAPDGPTTKRYGRKQEAESLAAHRHVKSRGVKSQDTRARIRQRLRDSEADRREPAHLDGPAHGPPRMPWRQGAPVRIRQRCLHKPMLPRPPTAANTLTVSP